MIGTHSRTAEAPSPAASAAPADRWAYRPDVDGLRAVAILLVVTYHVWFGRVSGGVDVFLMLSAFFLTRGFLRRMAGPAPVRPVRHLLGIFRRLLPAAAVVLVAVLAVVRFVYPPTSWLAVWEQTWASLAYVQNWLLASESVDYYTRTEVPSPLQHFWSMSVQGQAFVLWVVVLWLCQLLVRRRGWSPDRVVAIVFGAVFALSFVYSVIRTATAQQAAYFDTGARLWEFAAGSLLVVALPYLRLGPAVRAVIGWVGLAGLLVLGILVDVRGGFPGFLALWPVLCAAAIVASGAAGPSGGPYRLLASRPLQFLGRDAYALYLVHWPVLVTWMVVRGRTEVGLLGGAFVIVLSLVLARAVTVVVDTPVRAWRREDLSPRVPLAVLSVFALVVALPLAAWQVAAYRQYQAVAEQSDRLNPGAAVLINPLVAEPADDAVMIPLPTALNNEWTQLDHTCSGVWESDDSVLAGTCLETERTGRDRPTVAVIGDSHAHQFASALLPVAEERGWDVVMLIRGFCSMGLDERANDDPAECDAWRESAISLVERASPAAVLTVVTRTDAGDGDEVVRPGLDRFLDRMDEAGIGVIGIRDNPRFPFDVYNCIVDADDPLDCAMPRSSSLADVDPARDLEQRGVDVIDLTPWFCPDDYCLGEIGNIAVYIDSHHPSASYVRTLAPILSEQLPLSLN